MKEDTVLTFESPEVNRDFLTEVLRAGARKLLKVALDAEVETFLESYQQSLSDGRNALVRNGFLPERGIQTGIGEVKVTVPRIRDRRQVKSEVQFSSRIVPSYLRRSVKMQEFLPLLYLKGISTGDFKEALAPLMGDVALNISANTICRLKTHWEEEFAQWNSRSLSRENYVYIWADGVYFQARMEEAKDCVLVVMGVTDNGTKELIAIEDGYRESKESWVDLLRDLKKRGLSKPPKVAVGDGALGFWGALNEVYPETKHQRCWFHKMGNVLNCFPKTMHAQVKSGLQAIWMAPTREKGNKAFDDFIHRYGRKYPKARQCLEKDREAMMTFYDFPAEHWKSLRTSNPIESTFATVRHRTKKSKGCYSRQTMLTMVYKLSESAEKRWRRLYGFRRLAEVIEGIKFVDGVSEQESKLGSLKDAA